MRSIRIPAFGWAVALFLPLLSGCNYVHFGRQPAPAGELMVENSRLETENAQLQQQLALARQQSETLRAMIDNPASGQTSPELVEQLNDTTRQLATLRTEYTRLLAERDRALAAPSGAATSSLPPDATPEEISQRLTDTEDKLSAALRTYTLLQEENAQLREQLDQTQAENATLTTRVSTLTSENQEIQAALAQLNTEMLAQRQVSSRAAQEADSLRMQLGLANQRIATLSGARTASAGAVDVLSPGLSMSAPVSAPAPTARLETSPELARARVSGDSMAPTAPTRPSAATPSAPPPASEPAPRTHVIAPGDTLSAISLRYYGTANRWPEIYEANRDVIGDAQRLVIGRTIRIP